MSGEYKWKSRGVPVTRRLLGQYYGKDLAGNWVPSGPVYSPPFSTDFYYEDYERTCSMGHPGPPYKEGGPFLNYRYFDGTWMAKGHGDWVAINWPSRRYVGGFTSGRRPYYSPSLDPLRMGSGSWDSYGDPTPYGPSAWARYRPGKSVADLSVVLAEIRDVPRTLQTTAKGFRDLWRSYRSLYSKEAANQWLNTQFGWLPFLSDLRKLLRTYRNAERLYNEVLRNNGQWVRKGGSVKSQEDVQKIGGSTTSSGHYPILDTYFLPSYPNTGSYEVYRKQSDTVWFEGKFRYYIPNVSSVIWRRNFERQLYGLTLNPAVVWELVPWSWLIDWVSNVGDNIENLSDGWAENLAAAYAYVMGTSLTEMTVNSVLRINGGTHTSSWSYSIMTKRRAEASPFGFNLTWDAFSPRQLVTLSALGITRTK